MGLEVFLKGIVIGLVASIPLGPVGLMCVQRTLSKSHRSGFVSGLGAATADSLFATVALFSLTFVMSFIENNMAVIKVLGGISVVIVGVTIFLKNPVVQIRRNRAGKGQNLWSDYLSIFFITLTNPAYILIFVALFAALGNHAEGSIGNGLVVILGVLAGGFDVVVPADVLRGAAAPEIPSPAPALDEPHFGQRDRRAGRGGHSFHFFPYSFRS